MKTSKAALHTSIPEECGVWLDTVELKAKAKQKQQVRPISKLLNPFTGGTGYSLAVALKFTQTKVEMPKTKQSSISTFFAPQRRVVHKMSTLEVPSVDPVQPPSLSTSSTCDSTSDMPVTSGTKRRRELDIELCNSGPGLDHERKSTSVAEPETAVLPSRNTCCDFEEEQSEDANQPRSKKKLTAASLLPFDSQPPPLAWSQDPLLTCSQYSEGDSYPTSQENTEQTKTYREPSFFNSLQSQEEEAFGFRTDVEGRTSTQKSCERLNSSHSSDDKENSWRLSSKSPTKHSPHLSRFGPSNHTRTELKTASPQKHTPVHRESGDSQFEWLKPRRSPLKKAPQPSERAADEDSLAMLFTQDSEGFRVIAHRGPQARSPLKDQSNISTGGDVRTSDYRTLVDEEDDMLFTQDSQGHLVIKH